MTDTPDPLERRTGRLLSSLMGRTLLVTLDRPEVAHALDQALMDELADLWLVAAADPRLRAIVVTASGRAFCSGADASMLSSPRERLGDRALDELRFLPGHQVDVPVITAVNGVCAGGGLHFLADADICVAAASARFLDPHVSVGQVSALEPLTLRMRMRPDLLTRMVLLGRNEALDADQALGCGLVSEVVPDKELLNRALALADGVAANSPEAVRLSRRVLRDFDQRILASELDLGWELIRRHRAHPDATEGPQAFLDRRAPQWKEPS